MKTLKQGWEGISTRERMTLSVGVLGVLAILAYALVWQPWQDALQRLRAQVPAKQETLAWMQSEARTIEPLMARKQQQRGQDDAPLLTVVESTAKEVNIHDSIRRISPGEKNEVKVWLTDADFDKWLQWLEVLRQRNVEVSSASVNRAAGSKVTIRVTVAR